MSNSYPCQLIAAKFHHNGVNKTKKIFSPFKSFFGFSFTEAKKAEDLQKEGWQSESESKIVYREECSFENRTYHVGEFVYVEPSEPNLKPHVVCIERLWEDETGKNSTFYHLICSREVNH